MSTSDVAAPTRRFPAEPLSGHRESEATGTCDGCFAVGDVIASRYELQSVLAAGSMGRIWTARDNYMARRVAVKLPLCPDEQDESRLRGELLFEARMGPPPDSPFASRRQGAALGEAITTPSEGASRTWVQTRRRKSSLAAPLPVRPLPSEIPSSGGA